MGNRDSPTFCLVCWKCVLSHLSVYFIILKGHLSQEERGILRWILQNSFQSEVVENESFLRKKKQEEEGKQKQGKQEQNQLIVEIGPRLNFSTAFSTNAVAICEAAGLPMGKITRLERSIIYLIHVQVGEKSSRENKLYISIRELCILTGTYQGLTDVYLFLLYCAFSGKSSQRT